MIKFRQKDIENWSSFSGDFNSLHYLNKTGNNTVQGMLVYITIMNKLIQLKQTMTGLNLAFRQLIHTNNNYFCITSSCQKKLTITDNHRENIITGNLLYKTMPLSLDIKKHTSKPYIIKLKCNEIRNNYFMYLSLFPHQKDYRIFITALIFKKIIHSYEFLNFNHYVFPSLDEFLNIIPTIQMSQYAFWHSEAALWHTLQSSLACINIFLYSTYLTSPESKKIIRYFHCQCYYKNKIILNSKTITLSDMNTREISHE